MEARPAKILVVGAAIIKDGKIFCVKRGKGNHETLGKWEFPGGKVEPGEEEEQALEREIKEELDFEISVNDKVVTSIYEYEFGTVEMTTYICSPKSDKEPKLSEHTDSKWLLPTELEQLDGAPVDKEAVKKMGGYSNAH